MPKKQSQIGRTVYICDGRRSPQLKARNKPGPFSAADLAVNTARNLLVAQSFAPSDLDSVIVGCAIPSVDEANIARIIALRLGCGNKVEAFTVHRNCGTGMQAIDNAAQLIALGRAELILAGGTEAMSHSPLLFDESMAPILGSFGSAKTLPAKLKAIIQLRPKHFAPVISLIRGLKDPIVGLSMGQTAEVIANRFGVTREEMDAYSVQSHQRLARAIKEKRFTKISTLIDQKGKIYESDDGLREDSTVEKLAKLKPYFDKKYGNVTPGNSSQVSDGAAFLILACEEAINKYDLPVLGKIVDTNWAALEPREMGLGPVYASTPILQRNNLGLSDIDSWEINEAFAAQLLACLAAWKDEDFCKNELGLDSTLGEIDSEILNQDGGGISLGHPIAATGARLVLHSLDILKRKEQRYAMATMCIGGGQGGAMLLERVSEV